VPTDDLDGRDSCALTVPHAEGKRFGVWESVQYAIARLILVYQVVSPAENWNRLIGGRYQCLSDQNLEAPDMRIRRFYETLPQRYSRFAVLR